MSENVETLVNRARLKRDADGLVAAIIQMHDGELTLGDNDPGLQVVVTLRAVRAEGAGA